jgi:uncharacterized membrane protein
MKRVREFVTSALVGGLLVVVPAYLAFLLLLKAMSAVAGLVRPIAALLPEWIPGERLLALVLVLLFCFVVGVVIRTPVGRVIREKLEKTFFERLPGYEIIRGLTLRVAGTGDSSVWQPALAEIEDALVPAFIIEEHDDGNLTVFVPSVPTPLAGAVYVLARERVHVVDVPFTQAIRAVSRWGSGSKVLVAAMKSEGKTP